MSTSILIVFVICGLIGAIDQCFGARRMREEREANLAHDREQKLIEEIRSLHRD